ncbi:MAG: DUF2807 domain-containing protein [Alphaproteobacteria bacterium]|nr:DUF2807 domain-containing protein [Alphaproteobacteria bacterium]MDE2162201.1 DUF2807 domain-containing protein [Alphaproteobacteria bacterium]MDE2498662.1 DUF2807 domain-containing protein [Alphaproteobacteria bacterium]
MKYSIAAALFALPLVAAAPSWAGTVVPLAPFSAIEVHGGGEVILHHGTTQRVTLVTGSLDVSELKVVGDKLVVSPCKSFFSCPMHNDLSVDIVSPRIDRIAVHGGGDLTAKGAFPKQPSISVEAHGGGDIDVRAIPADKAEAEVHGGGDVHLGQVGALNAEAHGGGDITYQGNPQPFVSSVHGGGSVSRQ